VSAYAALRVGKCEAFYVVYDERVVLFCAPGAGGGAEGDDETDSGAFYLTPVPTRPRCWRGERRFLRRTLLPGVWFVSLRPGSLAFNPDTPRRLPTPLLTPFNSTPISSLVRTITLSDRRARVRARHERGPRALPRRAGRRGRAVRRPRRGRPCRGSIREGLARRRAGGRSGRSRVALVPVRPRRRGERRSLRTFADVSLRPPFPFNPRPRRLSTPTDAFQLHPGRAGRGPPRARRPREAHLEGGRESKFLRARRVRGAGPRKRRRVRDRRGGRARTLKRPARGRARRRRRRRPGRGGGGRDSLRR